MANSSITDYEPGNIGLGELPIGIAKLSRLTNRFGLSESSSQGLWHSVESYLPHILSANALSKTIQWP